MSEVGEIYRAMREAERAERAARLAATDTTGWTRHSEHHFSRMVRGRRLSWWPSTQKAQYNGKMFYGPHRVAELFKQMGITNG